MKIVNILSSRDLGGTEQAFLDYNEALAEKGNEVFAIYNKNGKIKYKIEKAKKFKNIKYLPSVFFKPHSLLLPIFFLKLLKIKPDVIIVQSKKVLALFSFIAHLLKIPVIAVCHNEKIKLLNMADYIFATTEHERDVFVSAGYDLNKIFIIPNLITTKLQFKELNEYSKPPIFGVIGRFEPVKGFDIFIQACGILLDKGYDFRVKIAGTPQIQYLDEYKRLKKLVKVLNLDDRVDFMGWVDNKDEFYNNIDIFVLPSNHESFGIVLLEAMMYSKPIITSLAEGPKDIFKNTDAAIAFTPTDYNELAEKMIELLKNPDEAKKIAKNGYELVNKKYTIDVVGDVLQSSLEKCIMYNKNKRK